MLIYLFLFSVYYCLAFVENYRNRDIVFVICSTLFFFYFAFHNGQFGGVADYCNYLDLFLGIPGFYGSLDTPNDYELEKLYYYYCNFLRLFGKKDFIYIWSYAIIIVVPIIALIKKYSNNYAMSFLFIMIITRMELLLFLMHAHRQMLATFFLLIAFYLYDSVYFKQNIIKVFCIVCLVLAVVGHSSSLFVVSFFCLLLFFEKRLTIPRRMLMLLVGLSVPLGFIMESFIKFFMNIFMFSLADISLLERTTSYIVDDIYGGAAILSLRNILLTITALIFIWFSNNSNRNSFFLLSFSFATFLYNLFTSIPLVNRSLTVFLLFGCIGAVPALTKKNDFILSLLIFANIYICYRCIIGEEFWLKWEFLF